MSLGNYSLIVALSLLWFGCGEKEVVPSNKTIVETSRPDTSYQKTDSEEKQKKPFKSSPMRIKPLTPNRISQYDDIIKKYSRRYGFDWRLIAAQIFAESHFRPEAKSRVGALGLMQIMPSTAEYLGVNPKLLLKPEQNIALGCLYDRRLYNLWDEKQGKHRLAFTFASYNAGRRRVLRTARKTTSPHTWEGIKPYLPGETRIYVTKIFKRYDIYKKRYLW